MWFAHFIHLRVLRALIVRFDGADLRSDVFRLSDEMLRFQGHG